MTPAPAIPEPSYRLHPVANPASDPGKIGFICIDCLICKRTSYSKGAIRDRRCEFCLIWHKTPRN